MNTIAELEEQSRLAVIAYLSDMDKVELEFTLIAHNPDNMKWSKSNGIVDMHHCYYRIAPKKLWYKVALCCKSEDYYTTTVDSDEQIRQCELRNDFIKWHTPDKVYYTADSERYLILDRLSQ